MTARDDESAVEWIMDRRDQAEASVFLPENLLREARRQLGRAEGQVPAVCVLDPDGDIVRSIRRRELAHRSDTWACYHTDLWETEFGGLRLGVVGCAVGAPFAVLVAEQLFVSGCELLISITSAGQVAPDLALPCYVVIDRALRAEGTSASYLPSAAWADADAGVVDAAEAGLATAHIVARRGATWTTDAPYRETASALAAAADAGIMAVEMEAAALYAFGRARKRPVICLAHVTNQMAQSEGDFEKGPDNGADEALAVVGAAAAGWFGRDVGARG